MKNISISEYGYIGCDGISVDGNKFKSYRSLTNSEFLELKNYWESNEETFKVFTLANKNCLKAINYVGVIQTENLSIEILPKIYNNDEDSCRNIFIQMLKPLLGINEILIDKASLNTYKNKNIFELFITMFINNLDFLIHKGLKSDYILKEENQYYLKGKLKFNQHIKENYIHKERFYVEFDEYIQDRVENKLLKSTIQLLLKKTIDSDNKKRLRQQLFIFDSVNLSTNHETNLKKVNLTRGMEYYKLPLRFAEVFLLNKSFSSFRGKDNVFALLFPMNKVFEDYMEFVLENSKKSIGVKNICINGYTGDYLLDCEIINQEPDYLLEMNDEINSIIICDAKWKIYNIIQHRNKSCKQINLSSDDAYQMLSYLNFYTNARDTAYILAPENENFNYTFNLNYLNQKGKIDKKIKIVPISLHKMINTHTLSLDLFK